MRFDTLISDKYEGERSWIEAIPQTFEREGTIVQAKARRNTLKKVEHGGKEFCIKSFHIPSAFNRVVYTHFRKSKAERSYRYALELDKHCVGTPEPVALITEIENGLLKRSYYVCRQLPDDYQEIRYCYFGPLTGNEETLTEFARFTADLHDKGIYHTDYSPGNILFKKNEDGSYDFQLVDINRMQFREVTPDMGCRNFARLFECDEIYRFVAKKYAEARGLDPDECERLIMKYQQAFNRRKLRKRTLKKLIGRN